MISKHNHWRSWWQQWQRWCRREPLVAFVVCLAVAIGAWLRFFRLPQTMMFMGDQGRDALIVANIFRHADPVFIGPVTSVGNMYLGPFYYYFMLPWLWLTYPSPLGPTIGVALVNVVAIALTYFLGRRLVGKRAALIACVLTSFSAVAVTYSRFSWNPNLSLIFSLLLLYSTHAALTRSSKHWLWVGLWSGILIQLHYVNLIVVAVSGMSWLATIAAHWRQEKWWQQEKFWWRSLQAAGVFGLTCVPLFLFDARHSWRNIKALGGIFTEESSFADSNIFQSVFTGVRGIFGRIAHLFTTLTFPKIEIDLAFLGADLYWVRVAIGVIILVSLMVVVARETFAILQNWQGKNQLKSWWQKWCPHHGNERLVGLWLLLGTCLLASIALAFYRHSIFDHYLLFFLPVLFLTYGVLLTRGTWKTQIVMLVIFGLIFIWSNRPSVYLLFNGLPYSGTRAAVERILAKLPDGHSFDFILIDANGDLWGEHYRYFFEALSPNILPHDQFLQADDFLVIDETHQVNLYDNPSYELVVFRNLPEATYELLLHEPERDVYHFWREKNDNLETAAYE